VPIDSVLSWSASYDSKLPVFRTLFDPNYSLIHAPYAARGRSTRRLEFRAAQMAPTLDARTLACRDMQGYTEISY
jgi:hypothetical protein